MQIRLNFEAVMLDAARAATSTVWVHVRVRVCGAGGGCRPGCGPRDRVRRAAPEQAGSQFSENIELRVVRPADGYQADRGEPVVRPTSTGSDLSNVLLQVDSLDYTARHCSTFLVFGILMGCLLILASGMMCLLACRCPLSPWWSVLHCTAGCTPRPGSGWSAARRTVCCGTR